ncbi:CAP domain-containing protein [Streptomyces tubercidicus]|uniref:CAP domain-containing protein n=1 Tax=Streptomyces tubercidicus TaxID=47759 RepID=UPI003F5C340F
MARVHEPHSEGSHHFYQKGFSAKVTKTYWKQVHWSGTWLFEWSVPRPQAKGKPATGGGKSTPSPTPSPRSSTTPSPTPSPRPSTTPSPTAAATASPSPSTTTAPASDTATRILELVNDKRSRKEGCSPLTLNNKLNKAAQDHSQDMADHQNMSHTGSDGSSADERVTRAGYKWSTTGENVAHGYTTPESVMEGWMHSPGHRANILNCSFKELGVGLAQPGNYWTQDFGATD